MVDYGLKCWDADRNVTLDTSEKISRVRFKTDVAGTTAGNITLPDIVGKSSIQFAISLEAADLLDPKYAHIVSRNGSQISWRPLWASGFSKYPQTGSSTIVVMLLD